MKNVTVETKLTINLTADQWQLYSTMTGVDAVATMINRGLEKALNESANAGEAYAKASRILGLYSDFGATDSEPSFVLDKLIQLRFPGEGWQ